MTPVSFCLFGAAPDTGNLGVSALCFATLAGLFRHCPQAEITVFDSGRSLRVTERRFADREHTFYRCGGQYSRRLYRSDSLWTMWLAGRLGGLGNQGVRRLRRSTAVLDLSGGDSFTDLYGPQRFGSVVLQKRVPLSMSRPLVLLPQTYGPYNDPANFRTASKLARSAAMAWARDARSFDMLREMLGNAFDPDRHRLGVDVAFGLDAVAVESVQPDELREWLSADRSDQPLIGFNISGLLYIRKQVAHQQYGFRADYHALVGEALRRLLRGSSARVLLVPHVHGGATSHEADVRACNDVLTRLAPDFRSRVAVLPQRYNESETKWVISRCDWFCGTRMHSAIAGLSTGVPTTAIAYSVKTQGVFESCGVGEAVVDPRVLDTNDCADRLVELFRERHRIGLLLAAGLPRVKVLADEQLRDVVRYTTRGHAAA